MKESKQRLDARKRSQSIASPRRWKFVVLSIGFVAACFLFLCFLLIRSLDKSIVSDALSLEEMQIEESEKLQGSYYGGIFFYRHHHEDLCSIYAKSLKYEASCEHFARSSLHVKPLAIISSSAPDSKLSAEAFHRMNVSLGVGEIGPDGEVGYEELINVNSMKHLRSGSKRGKEDEKRCRFLHVFHQVTHPLTAISFLLANQTELQQSWHTMEQLELIHHDDHKQELSVTRKAMLSYLAWNTHIEALADIRYHIEDSPYQLLCKIAEFHNCNGNVNLGTQNREKFISTIHQVTWQDLDSFDLLLSEKIKALSRKYGYNIA